MYTQCPDCSTAFRITADDLKKAAGKVRCGGCSNAFNAIEYLSEQAPEPVPAQQPEPDLPELTPEQEDTDSGPIQSISAEQSAALLKTLDELAGSDIRIEDTGVEWRVLDEDEIAAREADDTAAEVAPEDGDAPPEVAGRAVDELRFDDDTPLPDEFDLDDEASFSPASSNDVAEEIAAGKEMPEIDEAPLDIALSEPEDWSDILGEFDGEVAESDALLEEEVDDTDVEVEADLDEDIDEDVCDPPDDAPDEYAPLDVDTQFALQAEAMGIEVSGVRDLDEESDEGTVAETGDEFEEDSDEETAVETSDEFEANVARLDNAEAEDESIVEHPTIQDELDALDDVESDEEAPEDDDGIEPPIENDVAAPGEDEASVDMMIDQELMALASEDEDGFASTVYLQAEEARKALESDETTDSVGETSDAPGFATIIMEGDIASSENTLESLAAHAGEAAQQAQPQDDNVSWVAPVFDKIHEHNTAIAIGLAALLLLQVVHQSRDSMATSPAFNNTVGAVYEAVGQPLEPDWDITAWRFEATKGSMDDQNGRVAFADENDAIFVVNESLTIYSRIGNTSDQSLPYPLIGVSLTDRFEETIGSRVMSPIDYLPKDADPDIPVPPGNSFDAVIAVQSSIEDATGFKLNVCYRTADNQLRCAIEDFK